ncbi:MAG: hypothetical protein U1E60_11005 [Reyranellaceae bacterium]
MKTITHVYDSYSQARAVVDALEREGFAGADVSLVANKHVSPESAEMDEVSDTTKGVGIGGALGGGAGLLAGLGMLAIPGLGPVVAAGWLASTAVVAAAGAAAGGIVGALVDAGLSREQAHVYSETVRRGGTLVTARVREEHAARAESIMTGFRPIDPELRATEYRSQGWKAFDPKAAPYRPSQAEIDRMRANWPG